jgi:POT family proton-dependent oligopeptide transporter
VLWLWLDKRDINPNIPMKFGLGIVQLGLGYLILQVGASMAGVDAKVPLFILVFMYMLHTTGELFLSPIGLSMVTKLAPQTMTGLAMGAWFLSIAFGNSVAAALAQLTGVESEGSEGPISALIGSADKILSREPGRIEQLIAGGQEALAPGYWDGLLEKAQTSLDQYVDIYTTMGLVAVGVGMFLVLLSKPLNRMMHGVR